MFKYLLLVTFLIGCTQEYFPACEICDIRDIYTIADLTGYWYTNEEFLMFGKDNANMLYLEIWKDTLGKIFQLDGRIFNNEFKGEGFNIKFLAKTNIIVSITNFKLNAYRKKPMK